MMTSISRCSEGPRQSLGAFNARSAQRRRSEHAEGSMQRWQVGNGMALRFAVLALHARGSAACRARFEPFDDCSALVQDATRA